MKRLYSFLVVALTSLCLTATARSLSGWGKIADPDHDCKFFLAEEELLIHVPGSAHAHDLAAEIHSTNAPRVLQSVKGDFTIEVRVDGRYEPGSESTKAGRTGYNGAGLVVMLDPNNVVTLARAALQNSDNAPQPYANFEIRVNGELERIGLTGDQHLPKASPIILQLQRRGTKITAATSNDGTIWYVLGAKEIPATWPKKLQTGIVAISTSTAEFNPRFSNLKISK